MSRARGWCFTLNNPSEKEGVEMSPQNYIDVYQNMPNVAYIVVGDEVAKTGTPHHQGYVYFKNPVRFDTVKEYLPKGCHIEQARGTSKQASVYCKKEKILFEYGECPSQGKRNDISVVKGMVNSGAKMAEIIDAVDSYQAIKCAELILKYKEMERSWVPLVYWFWGPTGTGKTRTAFEMCEDPWVSGRDLKWWNGYDAHEDVILDDFRGDFCTFHELLRILDRYPYRVETKGGSRSLLAKRIIITSAMPPEICYYGVNERIDQLLRRITEIREFSKQPTMAV